MGIYEDVALLQEQVAELQSKHEDSGWIDLPLLNGAIAYTEANKPQYRKIGNKVIIKGAVKNVLADGTIVGKLPENFRPIRTGHSVVQNTTYINNNARFSRLVIQTNGDVQIEGISEGASYGETKWFPLHCEFLID